MATTVRLSPEDLPDVTATKHDDGDYEVSITGLAGLESRTIAKLTSIERLYYQQRGIIEINPPTVRHADKTKIELLMLEAIERVLPDGTLDNVVGDGPALDKEHLLLGHVVRTVRRALLTLEVPE